MERGAHRLKPDGVHTGRWIENWNKAWRDFFRRNPDANKDEILKELIRLIKKFELE